MSETMRDFRILLISTFACLLAGGAPAAQPAGEGAAPHRSPLLQLARELGRAAGNAEFCAYDEDVVEDFIARALARLAKETKDQALLAGGRIEFNSHAAHGRASGPDEGCEAFSLTFAAMKRQLN